MELIEALRTTGAVRDFLPEPVGDGVVSRAIDAARFAPNGGNRQAWRVIVVRDPAQKTALRDPLPSGLVRVPRHERGRARRPGADHRRRSRSARPGGRRRDGSRGRGRSRGVRRTPRYGAGAHPGARRPDQAGDGRPRLRPLHLGGRSLGLPLRMEHSPGGTGQGLAGVLTTMVVRREAEVRTQFAIPDHLAVAALVALGRPVHQPSRLTRQSVEEFATVDRFDGPSLRAPG